jgi:histidyl-tRNA synthetase
MDITSPKGTYDIIPDETDLSLMWRQSHLWHYVESVFLKNAKTFGFKEIRTPLFERTELFKRGVGEGSDIVQKEMYTFEDKGGRSMTLRPEMTASVMRAFVEKGLQNQSLIHKLFYLGPMFRYDRPQAGRYRQFFQFGVEAIGASGPEQDVEVIDLLYSICENLGLKNLTLHINSVGDAQSRADYSAALKNFLLPKKDKLSQDSQIRLDINPLRILDSKDPQDHEQLLGAPLVEDYLSQESKDHFAKVLKLLDDLKIPYFINPKLVRGLDYYNKTVFELTTGNIGSQNAIGGGGRYDGLMKSLGGLDLPSVGFAVGIERILQAMINQQIEFPSKPVPELFVIALGDMANDYCFKLTHELRKQSIIAEMDFSSKKLKDRLKIADQRGAKKVLIVGEEELKKGQAELKDMLNRTSKEVLLNEIKENLL